MFDCNCTTWCGPELPLLGGLGAGVLGGLLGIGGGVIIMPILRFALGLPPALAAGTCITAVFFTTLGGTYRHYRHGNIDFRSLAPTILAGVSGCALFSLLFEYLAHRGHWLDLGIGLVFCLISVRMIAEGVFARMRSAAPDPGNNRLPGSTLQKASIGAVAGLFPGLLGIGTGGILVPAFTVIARAPVKIAMAASLACFCFNALVSCAFKIGQGHVALDVAVPLCAGTFLGANLGASLNRRLHSRAAAILFGTLFAYVAAKFIASAFSVRI